MKTLPTIAVNKPAITAKGNLVTSHLTVWGWIALILVLWVFSKVPIGNEILRYAILLLILLLVLINVNQLAVNSTTG